ncbi:MAG TPA: amino acid ABC transporter permease [Syntrophobacter fumaroxidans]|nr:amino acid ABC transporter permease [Syntrophobacter fumaroxidans]
MDLQVIARNLEFMAGGLVVTFEITAVALAGGLLWGILLGLGRLSRIPWIYHPVTVYVHFFRSQPLILVIFWFYFLVPVMIGKPLGAFVSTLIAFVAFEAAYFAEIVRGGVQSVSGGQAAAGYSCGLRYHQVQLYIILPQALRNMLPALTTQAVVIFQDTSLAYVIGLREFLRRVNLVDTREARSIELYLFAGTVYLVLCSLGSAAARRLERRREVGLS